MAHKKNVALADIVEMVNKRLTSPDSSLHLTDPQTGVPYTPEQAFRIAHASLLDTLLLGAGVYNGFNYQESEIEVTGPGEHKLRDGYDNTRRRYYAPKV